MNQKNESILSPLNYHKIITKKKILKLKKIKKRKMQVPKAHNYNFDGNEFKKIQDKDRKNELSFGNSSFQKFNKDIKPMTEHFSLNNKNDKIIKNINNKNDNIILLDENSTSKKETLLSSPISLIPSFPPNNINLDFSFKPFNLFSNSLFDNDNDYKFCNLEDMSLNENLEIDNYFNNFFNPVLSEPIFNWDSFISENPLNNGSNNNIYNSNRNENNLQNNHNNNINQNTNNNNQAINQNNHHTLSINRSNNNNQRINQNNNNINDNSLDFISLDLDLILDDFIFNRNRQRTNSNIVKSIKKKLNRKRFKKSESSNENRETCIICYEDFKNNQNVYSLPCSHIFHVHCLNNEIKYRQKCPICRNKL